MTRAIFGALRVEKTYEVLRRYHLALVVAEARSGLSELETDFIEELKRRKIPAVLVLNKCDRGAPAASELRRLKEIAGIPLVCASARSGLGIDEVKKQIIAKLIGENTRPIEAGLIEQLYTQKDGVRSKKSGACHFTP